jgi:hypothetical protein
MIVNVELSVSEGEKAAEVVLVSGVSNPVDLSKSGVLLQMIDNTTAEPRIDLLGVRIASEAHLSQARIAYLFACSTAENRATRLIDEVLHVVSGFQVAVFEHVIGFLWL